MYRYVFLCVSLIFVTTDLVANAAHIQDNILSEQDFAKIRAYFSPLPEVAINPENPLSPSKISLGRRLFNEEALSNSSENEGRTISCNSCHFLNNAGVDGLDRSIGIQGLKVPVNAPTVYNAAIHFRQFWDGRAKDVEEQALGPITAKKEMGFDNTEQSKKKVLAQLIAKDANYPQLFAKAFPDDKNAFNFSNIGKAIGAFVRTLMTPSRFDVFLEGERTVLSDDEKRGLKVFLNVGSTGCVSCHSGAAIGGSQYRTLGEAIPAPQPGDKLADLAFKDVPIPLKVPSLRNITRTGPYFHNGTIENLDDAIKLMATYQLNVSITDTDLKYLKQFLHTLDGLSNNQGD